MNHAILLQAAILFVAVPLSAAPTIEVLNARSNDAHSVPLLFANQPTDVLVDRNDFAVVSVAANLFADDVQRVGGQRPQITNDPPATGPLIIVGTLGHSAFIDRLAQDGKLQNLDAVRNHWEATLWQVVQSPLPGVERALVIVGSDRRGAAYGLTQLSEKIGVSPWYWWADVPAVHRDALVVKIDSPQIDSPGVKYRGIFINDEDWGINPWAKHTFDPTFGNIGPKTYEKIFELMLRLRLNYIWPAMHGVSTEFGSVPENAALADRYGIVAGASHCEPMLCNNVKWNVKSQGPWDYSKNRDTIHTYWEKMVKQRGNYEAIWTIGIRGIHDASMNGPKDIPSRIKLMTQVIGDERELLSKYVGKQWGPVAQCFVPYKEVQAIYDSGLNLPPDVTLVWTDDNFGYIRRFSSAAERKRPGGSGVYYHISYYGGPHSYTWINTTAPGLIWNELHKAWENDARTMWVVNVGDIKPAEIGIDFYSRLAWDPEHAGPDAQEKFLVAYAWRTFGAQAAQPIAELLREFYRLGTIRKPELMDGEWALSLSPQEAEELQRDYTQLLQKETSLREAMPAEAKDGFVEMVGFPARVLADSGLIFMADRRNVLHESTGDEISALHDHLAAEVTDYNQHVAGGKWNRIMPGLETSKRGDVWSSQVRWPWDAKNPPSGSPAASAEKRTWRAASSCDYQIGDGAVPWRSVSGLGSTASAMALLPVLLDSSSTMPSMEFDFQTSAARDAEALVDFVPTFRLVPGMKMRVAISVDGNPTQTLEVPGSSGSEDENGSVRKQAVQDNFARLRVPLDALPAGKHTLKIQAIDPGVAIDRVSLP